MRVASIKNFRLRFTKALVYCLVSLCYVVSHAETITLVGEDSWYPYSAVKDGQNRGFAVDVIRAAYAAVKIDVKYIATPYSRCLMLVQSGQELGCFDSLKDAKLEPDFIFHKEPIFKASVGIYARTDSPQTRVSKINVQELHKYVIGVTHGYTYGTAFESDTRIVREPAPSDLSNLRKLLLGRSDYSLIYTRIADYLNSIHPEEFKGKIQQVGILVEDSLYVSFSKRRPESSRYANALDQGLRLIKANGVYAVIEKKWARPEP
jgi:polar amino acid transport system substrate-binding protein